MYNEIYNQKSNYRGVKRMQLQESDEIYFSKTKEYFQEVISSYSIGNYRSATVMLYSVAISDLLFKLQELKDMYNDKKADEILNKINETRSDDKHRSKWEKEIVDKVYNETNFLNLESYMSLAHLYDDRCLSAHPALNENYELFSPSKEETIANIKNILNNILIKPPIFINNVIDSLTEDLRGKQKLYKGEDKTLSIYLNNKYYSKMPKSMKFATLKSLWKFCFCKPNNEECMNNLTINRKAMEILINGFEKETYDYIKENNNLFSVANNKNCIMNLIILLSKYLHIYQCLDEDTKLQVDKMIDKNSDAKAISWFKYNEKHLDVLKEDSNINLTVNVIENLTSYYTDIGELTNLIDFYIWYYGKSGCFDDANDRFEYTIEPFLNKMSCEQFIELIKVTDKNRQIWDRNQAYYANNTIMRVAKDILPEDFNYSQYHCFRFSERILDTNEEQYTDDEEDIEDDLPF